MLALSCRTLEKDPSPAESLTVKCARCDPDNPKAVKPENCPHCHGTGRVPTVLTTIVTELHASRLELLRGGKSDTSDDSL